MGNRACTWLSPYIQALLQSVDNCDSHVLDGKTKAMRPKAAQLEDTCSSSEIMLLIPLLDSQEASEPVDSRGPREGIEQCHIACVGEERPGD